MPFLRPLILVLLVSFTSNFAVAQASDNNAPTNAQTKTPVNESTEIEWRYHGGTYEDQRYSTLGQINARTIKDLKLTWFADYPAYGGQQATPLMVNRTLYVATAWNIVYAYDAASGKELWRFDPAVRRAVLIDACCGPVTRGVAYADGKIFTATLDGRLIALDAASGKQLWSAETVPEGGRYTITGAPRVANGMVFIGNGGAEFGVRGYVSAYNIETGALAWRFYTVPGDPAKPFENPILQEAAKTWHGEWWKYGGGGTVWDSMSYDPELNLLYIGVGNSTPYDPTIRTAGMGDNWFVSSIVALNADTGAYVWHYQTTPGDSWDYTATQNMIFADLDIRGEQRKVIMQAPKNGFFYVLDRQTGELLSANNFSKVTWATGIDKETGRPVLTGEAKWWLNPEGSVLFPSTGGAHNWHPMAFNPDSGYVYIPVNIYSGNFRAVEDYQYRSVGRTTGLLAGSPPLADPKVRSVASERLQGRLLAWDPIKQQPAWSVEQANSGNGGVLTTAGGLVFQGDTQGYLNAFGADDGSPLWRFNAHSVIIAPPISYRIDGQQYIAVLSGKGGSLGRIAGGVINEDMTNISRLLVFKLNGKGTLPEPVRLEVALPNWEDTKVDPQRSKRGAGLYAHYCMTCHGVSAQGNGITPDLRYSPLSGITDAFKAVVLDGVMASTGMASFSPVLTPAQTEDIRLYVVQQNQLARKAGDVSRVGR